MKLFAFADRLLLAVRRLARAVLGLALFGGAMLLALGLVLAVLLWSVLWGRRPAAVRTVWRQATARAPFGRGHRAQDAAEVVDVQAREVTGHPVHLGSGQGG